MVGDFFRDSAANILTIYGRGGLGKTALVCRVLKGFENDSAPEDAGVFDLQSVVYINCTRATVRLYPKVLEGVLLTLDHSEQDELRSLIDNPESTAAAVFRAIVSRLRVAPTVVLLDNFEDLLEAGSGTIRDPEMSDLIQVVVEGPQHLLKLIITSRVVPDILWRLSPNRHKTISLDQGIPSPHAELVLRKLDRDGSAGFKDVVESVLTDVVFTCLGYPRALEAFYSLKKAKPSKSIGELVSEVRQATKQASEVTRVIVGEAYARLVPDEQKVMQVLAIYGRPVSMTAVEFVLRDWAPIVEASETLNKLTAMHFVRSEGTAYYLHPIDREHARSFLTGEERSRLRDLASEYYEEIALPRDKWRVIADVDPYFEQFRLRVESQDAEGASTILQRLSGFLDERGAFEQMSQMAESLNQITAEVETKIGSLTVLAQAQWRSGRAARALKTWKELVELLRVEGPADALFLQEANLELAEFDEYPSEERLERIKSRVARLELIRPWDQANLVAGLSRLAGALATLGFLPEAFAAQQRATQLALEHGSLDSKEAQTHNLGNRYLDNGDVHQAAQHFLRSLQISEENGNPLWRANHLGAC